LIRIIAKDAYGNELKSGGAHFVVHGAGPDNEESGSFVGKVKDGKNGTYTVEVLIFSS